jgi:hypothetical protein
VAAQTPSNNHGLFYNSTNSLWENKSIATALGYTPANAATTLTINGVTFDLSTSRTFTVGSVTGSGASGQVAYWNGTSAQTGSNDLFWDSANGRLGIGTNTPAYRFDITSPNVRIANFNGTNVSTRLSINNTTTTPNVGIGLYANNTIKWSIASYGATSDFTFYNDTLGSDALFIKGNTNNVILGGSTTDSGQKFQVQGTTLLNGNVTFSSSTGMFWDATNSRLGIGTNAPSNTLDVNTTISGGGILLKQNTTTIGEFTRVGNNNRSRINLINSGVTEITFDSGGLSFIRSNNFVLGSTSDSGERLQVTGTAKITTSLDIAGGKVFSAYNSGGTNDALKISASNTGATFGVQNTNATGFSGVEYLNNSGTVQVFTGFNNNNNQEFRFNNIASGGYIDFLISSNSAIRIFNNRSVSINSNTDIASAQFQVTSTTKGFLPPRMTTTQKNAISSPAAGLVVYDTTLNKLCVYTTAWETITSV